LFASSGHGLMKFEGQGRRRGRRSRRG
jgi:hypothetical protein